MGLVRGTKLAVFGVLGAVLAQFLQWSSYELLAPVVEVMRALPVFQVVVAEYGPAMDWTVGAFVGVVAGDIVTVMRGEDVPLSPTIGVAKGALAAALGLLALPNNAAIVDALSKHSGDTAEAVTTFPGGPELVTFALAVWLGAVVGDMAGM